MTKVFCVRAEFGKYSRAFLDGGYIAIGWLPKHDLTNISDEESLRELYTSVHPSDSPLSVGQNVGQIARFLFEIETGDIVVTPMFESERLAIGRVTGEYYYAPNDKACPFPHRKPVEWHREHVLRSALSIPLQNTLRSLLTVYRVSRGDELARAAGLPVAETKISHTKADIYTQVLERVLELSPDEFEMLVKDLLASIGFEARHIGRQGDGGVDVNGVLTVYGFASIDLHVQVKRYNLNVKIGPQVIKQFRGSVPEQSQAAFVATCTYNKKAHEEALRPGFKRVGLIDGRQLVDILVEHYENISDELRGKLRLRKTLVPED